MRLQKIKRSKNQQNTKKFLPRRKSPRKPFANPAGVLCFLSLPLGFDGPPSEPGSSPIGLGCFPKKCPESVLLIIFCIMSFSWTKIRSFAQKRKQSGTSPASASGCFRTPLSQNPTTVNLTHISEQKSWTFFASISFKINFVAYNFQKLILFQNITLEDDKLPSISPETEFHFRFQFSSVPRKKYLF